jgi:hypothetical protein
MVYKPAITKGGLLAILWNISRKDGLDNLHSGEIIESYPEDLPYPISSLVIPTESHFMLSWHIQKIYIIYIVTAYEPDKLKWDENFRRRI